jgi:hypothetical protein
MEKRDPTDLSSVTPVQGTKTKAPSRKKKSEFAFFLYDTFGDASRARQPMAKCPKASHHGTSMGQVFASVGSRPQVVRSPDSDSQLVSGAPPIATVDTELNLLLGNRRSHSDSCVTIRSPQSNRVFESYRTSWRTQHV